MTEQLNNLRNTRVATEQNRLSLKSQLVDLDYQILRLDGWPNAASNWPSST